MIYAQFECKDNLYHNFTLSGHAESGPYGHDLVCSAVSALAIGTTNNLNRLAKIEPEILANEEEGGLLEVTLPNISDAKQRDAAQLLLASLYFSLSDIEESYREYLSVSKTDLN